MIALNAIMVFIIYISEAQVEHVDTTYTFPENVGTAQLGVRLVNLVGALQTVVNVR